MFERFTESARRTVTGAVAQAERLDHPEITEEHLLLALLDQAEGRAYFAFTALGVRDRRAEVESALADARRRGGLSKSETDALADLGIDVDAIVRRVEEAHGPGALGAGAAEPEPAGRARGRRRRALLDHRPFTAGAKKTLEQSLKVALGRGDKYIGEEHLLLALAVRPGVVSEVLTDFGAGYGEVERVMFGDGK
ncbi:peptidase [Streptomyces finlayi]|uniref:Peptidase n=1 Tax=Streptomyces finlayi TaxID=67296 RepID=A0A919C6N4_9ACTN|nr:Clp protease N-terminal domain-containing protein [Streptomyces finlayi]GHC76679.1 peptidase [Streptomyces finlayi]